MHSRIKTVLKGVNFMSVRKDYDEKLIKISELISWMGERTTTFIAGAVEALGAFDSTSAKNIRCYESEVDILHRKIEEKCIILIATKQPVANDLRFLISSIKISAEMERIADYANNIAKITQRKLSKLDLEPVYHLGVAIREMGSLVICMLSDTVKAHENKDYVFINIAKERDVAVNKANNDLFKQMIDTGSKNSNVQATILELYTATRYLERAADRTVNIAKWVFYMETGFQYAKKTNPDFITARIG